jgi:hypothetical protein
MLRDCTCLIPHDSPNPRHEGACASCGFRIPPEWTSREVRPFLDRLGDAIPGAVNPKTGKPSPTWAAFRRVCERREEDGRLVFGEASIHSRDNISEALEEAADGANYAAFDHIVTRHREGQDGDIDLALTVAQKFYEAYEALVMLDAKRHHAP